MTEPDAWMAYNNAGGAGLVPYLLKGRARDNTNLVNSEGPPAYDTDEWPQPLFTTETIQEEIELEVDEMANKPEEIGEEEWKGVLKLRDRLVEEVFKQKSDGEVKE